MRKQSIHVMSHKNRNINLAIFAAKMAAGEFLGDKEGEDQLRSREPYGMYRAITAQRWCVITAIILLVIATLPDS